MPTRTVTVADFEKFEREVELFKERYGDHRGWKTRIANCLGISQTTISMIVNGHAQTPMLRCYTKSLKAQRLLAKFREDVKHQIPHNNKLAICVPSYAN